ncbi:NAD(P)/FAD-dependent oxidoreductase [Algivirga pacifica]|uniref:NAD(P)/FAD-dependent oxidoreductase n=1 Tax=Algivirga pacifica TaxID=1162670 RepID=A0ABP9DFX0_9BACT
MKVAIIGGGAAGFFAGIHAAYQEGTQVTIFEKSSQLLAKVKVSGGGRCNVTHACFQASALSKHYPRGEKFLKKAFGHFMTKDTIKFFEDRGVELKTEEDGRMFPTTDDSQTIINCLMAEAKKLGVMIRHKYEVTKLTPQEGGGYQLQFKAGEEAYFDRVIITTGGSPKITGLQWLKNLGLAVESPVPSLFTFNMPGDPIRGLMGLSVPQARVKVIGSKLAAEGPLLITHWGMSGPAVLRLSAWGARELSDRQYHFQVAVSWVTDRKEEELRTYIQQVKQEMGNRKVVNKNPFQLPSRLWNHLLEKIELDAEARWNDLSKKSLNRLINTLLADEYEVKGKTTFKEEFVTCGGVSLQEINVKRMESKQLPGLFFAGEVLDIDGITGGFNFQAAWTTGYLAGTAAGAFNEE